MFNPSRDEARRFLLDAWRKRREKLPATPLETIAADIVELHPEYHALLESGDAALGKDWTPEDGETNPFLHMSLHLAIEEQLSVDQPPGIRAAFDELLRRKSERHAAMHAALECLGEALWRSQRDATPLDAQAYIECLRKIR